MSKGLWRRGCRLRPDTKNYQDFTVKEFKLKTAGPHDVTIHIDVCGERLPPLSNLSLRLYWQPFVCCDSALTLRRVRFRRPHHHRRLGSSQRRLDLPRPRDRRQSYACRRPSDRVQGRPASRRRRPGPLVPRVRAMQERQRELLRRAGRHVQRQVPGRRHLPGRVLDHDPNARPLRFRHPGSACL